MDEYRKRDPPDVPETHQISIRVGVTAQDREELLQQIRRHRMEDRMLGLGKILAVLVVRNPRGFAVAAK